MIKPIETQYKGYRFRSRLEARWAVFFDALGLKWEYEPEGFDLGEEGWYLPDFRLSVPGRKVGLWLEIKPGDPEPTALMRATKQVQALVAASGEYGAIMLGLPGMDRWELGFSSCVVAFPPAGRTLGETPDLEAIHWLGVLSGRHYPSHQALVVELRRGISAARSARFGRGGRG